MSRPLFRGSSLEAALRGSAPVLALTSALACSAAAVGAPRFGPFSSPGSPVTAEVGNPTRPAATGAEAETFLRLSYEFYTRVVSAIDGARCPHRPTCSRYGLLAVRRHGWWGMLLTLDRLQRGADSSALRRLRTGGDSDHLSLLDPLEESTFWFSP